jgi:hypothetical protein
MGFDPCNRALKIWKSIETLTPSSFWPATLQPLCLSREPKARVATFLVIRFGKGLSAQDLVFSGTWYN